MMKLSKQKGRLVLGIWLVLMGLVELLDLSFAGTRTRSNGCGPARKKAPSPLSMRRRTRRATAPSSSRSIWSGRPGRGERRARMTTTGRPC